MAPTCLSGTTEGLIKIDYGRLALPLFYFILFMAPYLSSHLSAATGGMQTTDIDDAKKNLRRALMARRKMLSAAQQNPPLNLLAHLSRVISPDSWDGKVVSFFYPIGSEIDSLLLLAQLRDLGAMTALPVVVGAGQPLIFRLYSPGDKLVEEAFGTRAPAADKPAVIPDVMFVPLLAFDDDKFRLGYGGGFYDRTIASYRGSISKLGSEGSDGSEGSEGSGTLVGKGDRGGNTAVRTIGLGWSGQYSLTKLPRGQYDMPLDNILTEEKFI